MKHEDSHHKWGCQSTRNLKAAAKCAIWHPKRSARRGPPKEPNLAAPDQTQHTPKQVTSKEIPTSLNFQKATKTLNLKLNPSRTHVTFSGINLKRVKGSMCKRCWHKRALTTRNVCPMQEDLRQRGNSRERGSALQLASRILRLPFMRKSLDFSSSKPLPLRDAESRESKGIQYPCLSPLCQNSLQAFLPTLALQPQRLWLKAQAAVSNPDEQEARREHPPPSPGLRSAALVQPERLGCVACSRLSGCT